MDDLVAQLTGITGTSDHIARQLLEMSGNSLEQAAVLFFDTDTASILASQGAQNTSTSHSSAREVIRIDSDDDEELDLDLDDDMTDAPQSRSSRAQQASAEAVAQLAQEEEDAAMAQRLQEEMYGGGAGGPGAHGGDDDIRAPIERTTETLVDPIYGGGGADFGAQAFLNQMRQGRRPRGPANPFNQVWDNEPDVEAVEPNVRDDFDDGLDDDVIPVPRPAPAMRWAPPGSSRPPTNNRQARLADLFRPPYDLMDQSVQSWDDARAVGKDEKKWILTNLQDMSDFACQTLNRDVWKDEAIKELVRANFVFLQYDRNDPAADNYISYYLPGGQHENSDAYPHVAIVDPRTGEQVKLWSGRPFPGALDFHAQLAEFLDRYSLDSAKKNPVQRTKAAPVKDVGRMTEDEMLEMALKASLGADNGEGSSGGGGSSKVADPDELTATPVPEPVPEASAFDKIATDHVHEEPAAGPTVTRIQFRHPGGRVIRRFDSGDRVERIYEWLKAEPLEGRAGVAFELKPVPAVPGHDLLDELDKTIGEAGLKNATVMIEYVE